MCSHWCVQRILCQSEYKKTLASSSSWSVLTPKRGIEVLERLELWDSFRTPLMWLIGLSFRVGDGISTSFCLSTDQWTNTHKMWQFYCFYLAEVMNVCVDWNHIVVLLTHESAGDVFRHLVTRAAHLWQVRQLSVQHPLKLQHKTEIQDSDVLFVCIVVIPRQEILRLE